MHNDLIAIAKLIGFWAVIGTVEYVWVNPEMIMLLVVLMGFDTVTGIGKRLSIGKKDITSRSFMIWLATKISVLTLLLLLAWTLKVTALGNNMAISAVIGLFIAGELYSSIQNIYTMKTGKEVTEYDAVSAILGGLLRIVRTFIEKVLNWTKIK